MMKVWVECARKAVLKLWEKLLQSLWIDMIECIIWNNLFHLTKIKDNFKQWAAFSLLAILLFSTREWWWHLKQLNKLGKNKNSCDFVTKTCEKLIQALLCYCDVFIHTQLNEWFILNKCWDNGVIIHVEPLWNSRLHYVDSNIDAKYITWALTIFARFKEGRMFESRNKAIKCSFMLIIFFCFCCNFEMYGKIIKISKTHKAWFTFGEVSFY
jgi:hypothetical protein